jgi:branched-chain amino acid transport system permease protein
MKALGLHVALLALVALAGLTLSDYHQGNLSRIMVLAIYAMGYNVLFGYTGLLSLGHAMFFAAGMYGLGLAMQLGGWSVLPALGAGLLSALALSAAVAALALRTIGVGFMIVTLMFAQAVYLAILYFGDWTNGDEGFVLQAAVRQVAGLDLTNPDIRFTVAYGFFAVVLLGLGALVHHPFGRVLVAVRENEARTRMLGYDVWAHKFTAVVISGTVAGLAGALYGLLFGYVGATFASVQYSIFPLLWVLLGGAGTTLGPFIGVLFMFYLIDYASGLTSAYMLFVGVALVLLTLFARAGLMGEIRQRWLAWLP